MRQLRQSQMSALGSIEVEFYRDGFSAHVRSASAGTVK